jgi:hypothetical protein
MGKCDRLFTMLLQLLILYRRASRGDDSKWRVCKDLKGGCCGLFLKIQHSSTDTKENHENSGQENR